MKRGWFKEITKEMVDTCIKLKENCGLCHVIDVCKDCPFFKANNKNNFTCTELYSTPNINLYTQDTKLVESAKNFIDKFQGDFIDWDIKLFKQRKLCIKYKNEKQIKKIVNKLKTVYNLEVHGGFWEYTKEPEYNKIIFNNDNKEIALIFTMDIPSINYKKFMDDIRIPKNINSTSRDLESFQNSTLEEAYQNIINSTNPKDMSSTVPKPVDTIQQGFDYIEKYAKENDQGWVADWGNCNQHKYYLYYNYNTKDWFLGFTTVVRSSRTYMSLDCAQQLKKILNK